MKTLLILRHAKSSWSSPSVSDHDRPLNKRGKEDAPRMGRWLRQHDLEPDLIVSSTAKRAQATAKRVAEGGDFNAPLKLTRDFYHASPDEYEAYLQTVPDEVQCVLIVGHNPGMEYLVEQLSGVSEVMPTCALAWFALPITQWRAFDANASAEMKALWRVREID